MEASTANDNSFRLSLGFALLFIFITVIKAEVSSQVICTFPERFCQLLKMYTEHPNAYQYVDRSVHFIVWY